MTPDDLQETARKLGLPEDDPAVMGDLQTLTASETTPPQRKQEWGLRARQSRPTGKANRLAVFALFCALLVPVLGIVFGVVALNEIEDAEDAERGTGMAKWAIGIGAVYLLLAFVLGVWLLTRLNS